MPVTPTYPGVYVEEKPSGARTVTGVSTASTAFVDFFPRGPMETAVQITNFRDFERVFGGLHRDSEASYGLLQYFNNGGSMAWVVRVADGAVAAQRSFGVKPNTQRTQDRADSAAKNAGLAATDAKTAAAQAATQSGPELASTVRTVAAKTQEAADFTQQASTAAAMSAKLLAGASPNSVAVDPTLEADAKAKASDADAKANTAQASAQAAKDAATSALSAATSITATVPDLVKSVQGSANKIKALADRLTALKEKPGMDAATKTAVEGAATKAGGAQTQAMGLTGASTPKDVKAGAVAVQDGLKSVTDTATKAQGKLSDDADKKEAQGILDAAKALQEQVDKDAATAGTLPDTQALIQGATAAADKAAADAAAAAQAASAADAAAGKLPNPVLGPAITVRAANPGKWGNALRVVITPNENKAGQVGPPLFQLRVDEVRTVSGLVKVVGTETYQNLSLNLGHPRYAVDAVNAASQLVQIDYMYAPELEDAVAAPVTADDNAFLSGGLDGGLSTAKRLGSQLDTGGPLDKIAPAIFNILCLPITDRLSSDGERKVLLDAALKYCQAKRAFLIIDPPTNVISFDALTKWTDDYRGAANISGAVYFPRLIVPDPLNEYRPREIGPSGTVAGIYARTDAQRGVWKAPAGIEAGIRGAEIKVKLTDTDSGNMNPLGINVLRSFPVYGNIVWGARTLAGADLIDSQWKYVPVRRLANFLEESLFQSLKWVVFEPNDERTWAQIRLQVGSFLAGLFAQGAFQGTTPDKAYFVACDSTTTTQTDINRGIVNVIIGYAPLKPAEFVILQFEQIAGQT